MIKKNKIAVGIPAYNEELLLQNIIDLVSKFEDKIVIIDEKESTLFPIM